MEKAPQQPVDSPALSERRHYPKLLSTDILNGNTVVEILHADQRYLLCVTRDNKLILTK